MSLFVAVIPPSRVIEHLHDAITDVRRRVDSRSVRWTAPDRWHLTLAFLGEPGSRSVRSDPITHEPGSRSVRSDPITPRPAESAEDDVAEHLQSLQGLPRAIDARLLSAGAFGRQVVWIGLEDGPAKDALALIARRIPALVRETGVTPDRRTWRPHLTIARMRSGSPDAIVSALSTYRGRAWDVDTVHLIRSSGGPRPVHHRIAQWGLA